MRPYLWRSSERDGLKWKSLIKKPSRGQDALVYMNSGTSGHDGRTACIKGWLEWLGMMSFVIASQQMCLMEELWVGMQDRRSRQ